MKRVPETRFPWKRARRTTPEEREIFRQAIENSTGKPRAPRGRPPLPPDQRTRLVSLRLRVDMIERARRLGAKRGIGYQTVMKEVLARQLA